MGDGDNHVLFDDQILKGEIGRNGDDLGAPVIAEAFLDLEQFSLDDLENLDFTGEDLLSYNFV